MTADHNSTIEHRARSTAVLDLRRQIEDYLRGLVLSREPSTTRLAEAMRYSLLGGGARIRPLLAVATAEALGRPPGSVLPLAAALEMIHTHSLVHADLPAMSDGKQRRGKAAAHLVFGEDVALLASDSLFAEAMALVFRAQEGEPARVLAAVVELTCAVGPAGLIGGQYIDRSTAHALDEVGLRELYELKTGRLMAAAVGTVLTLTGVTGPSATALRQFAAHVGVLHQIVDDIRASTPSRQRRPEGRDCATRWEDRTYVSVFGLERTRTLAREAHTAARTVLVDIPADTSTLERIADEIISAKLGLPA